MTITFIADHAELMGTGYEGIRHAFKVAARVASKTNESPVLKHVRITREGESLILLASDRYSIVKVSIPGKFDSDEEFETIVGVDVLAGAEKAIKSNIKRSRIPAKIKVGEHGYTITLGGESVHGGVPINDAYPKIDSLLDSKDEPGLRAGLALSKRALTTMAAVMPPHAAEQLDLFFMGDSPKLKATFEYCGVKYQFATMTNRSEPIQDLTRQALTEAKARY